MKYYLFLSVAIATVSAFAGTMGSDIPSRDLTWISSVSVGSIWASGGETLTFYLAPTIEKTYAARKTTIALAAGELFVGLQKSLSPQWLGQLGLAAVTTGNAKLQGLIGDDANSQFDNYNYLYKISNSRLAIKGKLLFDRAYWLMPWVSASVSVGFNSAHCFTDTPLIFEALPNAPFSHHTKTALTYALGARMQKALSAHWQIGVGYEFNDWGKNELGRCGADHEFRISSQSPLHQWFFV